MFASDQLKEGKKYDVDFNQQFIETELYDAKPTYKKFSSYRPGVKERNVSSMITYGYDTAYCLKSHCGVRGRNGLSREILHSNKAPRHHNNNFESNKRFFKTVAELRSIIN